MALTPSQQQSVNDSGGYYDPTGNWMDQSGSPGANQGGTAPTGGLTSNHLIQGLTALAGVLAGHASTSGAGQANVPPQLSQLLNMSTQRAAYQNPLFQAVNQGVYGMLPNFARQGTNLSGTLSNQVPPASSNSGGGIGPLAAGLGGAGIGAAIASALGKSGSGGKIPIQELIDWIKNHGQGPHVQGNQNQVPNLTPGPFDSTFSGWAPWGNNIGPTNPMPGPTDLQPPLTPNVTTSETYQFPAGLGNPSPAADPWGGGGGTGWPTDNSGDGF